MEIRPENLNYVQVVRFRGHSSVIFKYFKRKGLVHCNTRYHLIRYLFIVRIDSIIGTTINIDSTTTIFAFKGSSNSNIWYKIYICNRQEKKKALVVFKS